MTSEIEHYVVYLAEVGVLKPASSGQDAVGTGRALYTNTTWEYQNVSVPAETNRSGYSHWLVRKSLV